MSASRRLEPNWAKLLPVLPLWAALAAFAIYLRAAWFRLPLRVADHFSLSGIPNGWSPRAGFAAETVGVIFLLCAAFTVGSWTDKSPSRARALWSHALAYASVAFVIGTAYASCAASLDGVRFSYAPAALLAAPALGLGFLAGSLSTSARNRR